MTRTPSNVMDAGDKYWAQHEKKEKVFSHVINMNQQRQEKGPSERRTV